MWLMLRIQWIVRRTRIFVFKELFQRFSTACRKRVLFCFDHIARKNLKGLERLVVTGTLEKERSTIRWLNHNNCIVLKCFLFFGTELGGVKKLPMSPVHLNFNKKTYTIYDDDFSYIVSTG